MRRFGLETIARGCASHPWRTLAAWAVVLLGAAALVIMFLGGALTQEQAFTNDPESSRADALIAQSFPDSDQPREIVIIRSADMTIDDPVFRDAVAAATAKVMALGAEVVTASIDYVATPSPTLVSTDKHSSMSVFTLAGDTDTAVAHADAIKAAADGAVGDGAAGAADGFEVVVTGDASINRDFSDTASSDLQKGEIFGVGIALVILVVVFGALATAVVPLILALGSILLALGITTALGHVFEISFFITNMITMIGLAMGIDYSLFVVSRYREERAAGLEKVDAIARAGSTASRSVVFSGLAVILALAGLFLVPSTLFHSMAFGAIIAIFAALLAALTLLPALLGAFGDKVNALRVPFLHRTNPPTDRPGGFWDGLSRRVMRRPIVSLVAAVVALGALGGLGLSSIDLGSAGVETLPASSESRQGFMILEEEFPSASLTQAQVAVAGDATGADVTGGLARLQELLEADPAFTGPMASQISPAGDVTLFSFGITGEPTGDDAQAAARHLRADLIPAAFADTSLLPGVDILITGQTAGTIDYLDAIGGATPWVFLFVLGLSFLLLLVVFRSLLVPLKAIFMNLLSVGAAYGLMVAVFQKGWGADLLGLQQVEYVEAWVPLFLFAVLFGTSMDYHVFLLSRIREHFDQTGDNRESVAFGLRRTGGIITGAALIMVAVFGGFAAGDLVMFQQLGFGLAVAVFLDATIVRSILVPAAMRLLGNANWWFPNWLHWLPDLRVEPVAAAVAETPSSAPAEVTVTAPAPEPTPNIQPSPPSAEAAKEPWDRTTTTAVWDWDWE